MRHKSVSSLRSTASALTLRCYEMPRQALTLIRAASFSSSSGSTIRSCSTRQRRVRASSRLHLTDETVMTLHVRVLLAVVLSAASGLAPNGRALAQTDPLVSWTDGPAKQAIVEFVHETTEQSGSKFVPPEERVATFDQDGTLWVERPIYTQIIYCLDRVPTI